jgi:Polyketide cyclase / dehydrase and lipid transport
MASIHKEILIDVPPAQAWDALRDWGALHERLVPGFATGTEVDGRDRVVTFFTGAVYRERIIDVDDTSRRLVWSIVDGPYQHHNASAQVLDTPEGGTRFAWIADLLPDEAAEPTGASMDQALTTIKQTLEASAVEA